MKLESVRIREFKCILDSNAFTVGPVTCLVGKNESGKTAILQALYKLNPDLPTENGYSDLEYPRNKWLPGMQPSDLPDNTTQTKWTLDDEDLDGLAALTGGNILKSNTVKVSRGYNNSLSWQLALDKENRKGVKDPAEIIAYLQTRLPTFIYFNDYYTLPGKVSLSEFERKREDATQDFENKVFEALLALAGTTPAGITGIRSFERLRASLEAVSNSLSGEIFKYWSQNSHLGVNFGFDHSRPDDPPPFNSGYVFRTSIKDRRHNATVSFDERSRGFVWFFSFLVWFSQVKQTYGERLIILLDEPALNLHAQAQADLLRYINERLKPNHQVIYTTHSPFMVDPNNLHFTRTVEDVVVNQNTAGASASQIPQGTKVHDELQSTDPDTVSPIQAALGYNITQTLFVGKCNLLVEGLSDLLYLKWFSRQLKNRGHEYLDKRWTICPVGGLDTLSRFVALFGGHQHQTAVLADSHLDPDDKSRSLQESLLLKAGHIFTADMYTLGEEADIEDMIGGKTYVKLVNLTYGLRGTELIPQPEKEGSKARVLDHVEAHMQKVSTSVPEFDQYAPAAYLIENSRNCLHNLPDLQRSMGRFEQFFKDVNRLLRNH